MPSEVAIKSFNREFYDPHYVVDRLIAMRQQSSQLQLLYNHVEQLAFKPAVGANNVLGYKETYKAASPVKDPNSNETVDEAVFQLFVQDLVKPGTKDQYGLVRVSLTVGKYADTYDALLLAPEGSIRNAREYVTYFTFSVRYF
ncbi:MAG: hypothetical protein U0350_07110 [Caldilineaceae bacterium]